MPDLRSSRLLCCLALLAMTPFTSNVTAGGASEIDLKATKLARTIAMAPQVEGAAVTPDGNAVWAGGDAGSAVARYFIAST